MSILLIRGDARQIPLADKTIHCCVTSPPYWGLRDYGISGQFGLEKTPGEYIFGMVEVFREVKRVLRDDATLWLNMGDCYATGAGAVGDCPGGGERGEKWKGYRDDSKGRGTPKRADGTGGYVYFGPMTQPNRMPIEGLKPKDLVGMPWRLALALQADGWYLRCDIIWSKPNPMPESITDRPTRAHEYIFLLSKSRRYYYDCEAIKEEVTGEAHPRGTGVNPKARVVPAGWDVSTGNGGHGRIHKEGRNSRMHQDRDPRHPADRKVRCPKDEARDAQGLKPADRFGRGPGWRKKEDEGGRTYAGFNERWDQREASRSKQNESFSAAISKVGLVETKNKRSVWEVATQPFPEAHFATFPEELIKPCILAGCPQGGIVLDPFLGSGTTALVARDLQCNAIGLELNPAYIEIAKRRLSQEVFSFSPPGAGGPE